MKFCETSENVEEQDLCSVMSNLHFFLFPLQPLTSAERKKKFVEKLIANGQYEDYKLKRALAEKGRKDRMKKDLLQLPKAVRDRAIKRRRDYNRKKMTEWRRKKGVAAIPTDTVTNLETTEPTQTSITLETESQPTVNCHSTESEVKPPPSVSMETAYKTNKALSRATSKIRQSLPKKLHKKKAALANLLRSFSKNDRDEIIAASRKRRPTIVIKCEDEKLDESDIGNAVRHFCESEDVSRKVDNITRYQKFIGRDIDTKVVKQTRRLKWSVPKTYEAFLKHIQTGKASLSESAIV